jgi:hypothetical protein
MGACIGSLAITKVADSVRLDGKLASIFYAYGYALAEGLA